MDKKEQIVLDWINKAEQDLGMARLALKHQPDLRAPISFHCQQAAEKYLKAYLVHLNIEFKKTHHLSYLLDLISEWESVSKEMYITVEILEDYGVAVRYPGYFDLTDEDVTMAYKAAEKIKSEITKRMKG